MAGEQGYDTLQHCLFAEVINEFIDTFTVELYEHEKANIYQSLAVVMAAFVAFERLYFNVEKPKPKEKALKEAQSCEYISDTEAKRRAKNRIEKNAESLLKSCSLEDDTVEDELGVSSI